MKKNFAAFASCAVLGASLVAGAPQAAHADTTAKPQQSQALLKRQRAIAWMNARSTIIKLKQALSRYKIYFRGTNGSRMGTDSLPPPSYHLGGNDLLRAKRMMRRCEIELNIGSRRDYSIKVLETKVARPKVRAVQVACQDSNCIRPRANNSGNQWKGVANVAVTHSADNPTKAATNLNKLRKYCWKFKKADDKL